MRFLSNIILLLLLSGFASAKTDSLKLSPLKFLSDPDYQQYITGNDNGMGLIAEVNNYPSPKNVMVLAKKLGLSETQKAQVKNVLTEMNRKALEMGKFLIAEETKLNKQFSNNTINEGSLVFYTNKIGALQGELRNAYLKAHFRTFKILTALQLKKYSQLSNKNK